ncbi:unnamed protein product [Rangifer tarandus platyrhynchus]|uniref:Uncharacterized protein n=2 Tax=Rangifer tarandus platyrhynchus TaxID=3082113 RepID=A0AC59ZQL7_RANTA|nr:unnamed protein product [Rangifer tarandus platyrhynchus]
MDTPPSPQPQPLLTLCHHPELLYPSNLEPHLPLSDYNLLSFPTFSVFLGTSRPLLLLNLAAVDSSSLTPPSSPLLAPPVASLPLHRLVSQPRMPSLPSLKVPFPNLFCTQTPRHGLSSLNGSSLPAINLVSSGHLTFLYLAHSIFTHTFLAILASSWLLEHPASGPLHLLFCFMCAKLTFSLLLCSNVSFTNRIFTDYPDKRYSADQELEVACLYCTISRASSEKIQLLKMTLPSIGSLHSHVWRLEMAFSWDFRRTRGNTTSATV